MFMGIKQAELFTQMLALMGILLCKKKNEPGSMPSGIYALRSQQIKDLKE